MKHLTLWSPTAHDVDVVEVSGKSFPMRRHDDSWEIDVDDTVADSGYKFSIDGNEPIPDPRSRFQPDGVHGYSALPQTAFDWTDASWKGVDLASSVLYELHVGTFSTEGTFLGIIEHLDHLIELGIDIVELMPVAEFAGSRGWGYDGVDLWAPHHIYGSPNDLKQLVNECHRRRLGVFLDVVYNHLGPEGNYLRSAGPYFTAEHTTPWGDAINFDGADNNGVRSFVLDNAAMWLSEFHFDGLRVDATHAIVDDSPSHIIRDMVARADAITTERGWPAWITVESARNDPVTVEDRDTTREGWGAHAQWNDDFHHSIHVALTQERNEYYSDYEGLDDLVRVLHQNFALVNKWSPHRQQIVGKPANHIAHDKFVSFIQNHDHVGNRAQGERLGHIVESDALYVVAAINILGPFIPLLFQGEEWGASTPFLFFTDYGDPQLALAVREGRTREFQSFGDAGTVPDPQDEKTFLESKLNWPERDSQAHSQLLGWYKQLITLRHNTADFQSGPTSADLLGKTLLMGRGDHVIAANFDTNEAECELSIDEIILSHGHVEANDKTLKLGPHAIAVAIVPSG